MKTFKNLGSYASATAFLLIITSNLAYSQDATPVVTASNATPPTTSSAPTTTQTTPTKAEGEEEVDGKLTVSGYLDSYYFTNFNKPASRDNMGQSGVGRGFDRRVDQFGLGMVQTVFTYKNKKSEAVADLAFGPSAQYGNYGNIGYGLDVFSILMIKQAYFKYNVSDKWSFTAGQFGTHIGYEYIDAPLNFFYSINHTFNSGIPFYHTGLKSTYVFSDKVSLMLGVVNGFDFAYDNNRSKGIIGQLSLAPAEGFTVYLNYINTNETNADATGSTPSGNFTVYDLNGGYQVSEKFFVGYWAMFGSQKGTLGSPGTFVPADGDVDSRKTWWGANLYLTYAIKDNFSLGFRGERFDNSSGARGLRNFDAGEVTTSNPYGAVGATANTYTLTGSWTLADGHLILKPELRMDVFEKVKGAINENSQQFMDSDGIFSKNSQTTLGLAAIYKF